MSADTVADRRTHPATVPLHFLKQAPSTLLGLPAAFAFMSDVGWVTVLRFAGLLAVAVLVLFWLAWRSFRYGVGAHDIVIESGLLNRTRRSIPFNRIQDVDIERGPLQRLYGLAKIRIETGGSAKDEGLIDSVTLAEADRLRAAVRAGRTGGLIEAEDAVAAPAGRTVFAMSVSRVLIAGLFNFSLVYLAGLFGLLQTFKEVLPFDIYDPGRWLGLVDERLRGQVTGGAIIAVLLVALVVGVLFGIARTLAKDYGFQLSVEGERFRRTRGLFTRSEVVLAKKRVQLALFRTGPLRKAVGWGELHFQTLSGEAASGARQSVAPLANDDEVAAILAEQGRLTLPDPASLVMVSSRHIVRTFVSNALLPFLIILAAGIAWRPALLALLIVPLLVAVALLERRFHRYALTDELLFIKRGVWKQQLWIVPAARTQTVRMTRTFVQRRLGLATLAFDTAGAPVLGGPQIVDIRLERARALADTLSARLRSYSGKKSGTER